MIKYPTYFWAITTAIVLLYQYTAYCKDTLPGNTSICCFIENKGQITDQFYNNRSDIDFKLENEGLNIFIGSGQIHYQWSKYISAQKDNSGLPCKFDTLANSKLRFDMYRLDMELVGANKNSRVIAESIQPYYANYYLQQFPKGFTVHSYNKIIYKNIYPHIDWVLYVSNNGISIFKYDFIVHEGGNPDLIQIRYSGAETIQLKDGACEITTPMGSITEQAPYCYTKETRQKIKSNFVLHNNTLSFSIDKYDGELIIDPALNWGTYYGNPFTTHAYTVTTDSSGNAYLSGNARGPANIATHGSHQTVFAGGTQDVFIAKFNINGGIMWGTYYGTSSPDAIAAAITDSTGYHYITGWSTSDSGLATTGAQQYYNNGDTAYGHSMYDCFLAKFSPQGQLVWGTYYGSQHVDYPSAIDLDRHGGVYIGGATSGTSYLASTGAFQTSSGNGFIARFNTNNGTRDWGTFYNAYITTIACTNDTMIYFGGHSDSYSNVATSGAHQPTHSGGIYDAIILKFSISGKRIWGTYFGVSIVDETTHALTTDFFHNVYFNTDSIYSPSEHLLIKLNPSGQLQWSRKYYKGAFTRLFFGPDGVGYFASAQPVLPAVVKSYASLGKFTRDGISKWIFTLPNDTVWIPYAAFTFSKYYFSGTTPGNANITTSNGLINVKVRDTVLAFIQQYEADTNIYLPFPTVDTPFCTGDTIRVKYGATNFFRPGNVFYLEVDTSANFNTPQLLGSKADNRPGIISFYLPHTVPQKNYRVRIRSTAPADTFYNYNRVNVWKLQHPIAFATPNPVCENSLLTLDDANIPYLTTNYIWYGPNGYMLPSIHNALRPFMDSSMIGTYIVECNNNGCVARDSISVGLIPSPEDAIINGDTSLCLGDSLHLNAISPTPGVTYAWLGPGPKYYAPQTQSLIIANSEFIDSGYYKVIAIAPNGCSSNQEKIKKMVTVHPNPFPSIISNAPICAGETLELHAIDTIQNVSYLWTGPNNFYASVKDTNIINASTINDNYNVITTSIHGCRDTAITNIIVKPLPADVHALVSSPVCANKTLQFTATSSSNGVVYNWSGVNNFNNNEQNPHIPATMEANGMYILTTTLNGCSVKDTVFAIINKAPAKPELSANTPLYEGQILEIKVTNVEYGVSYLWTGPNNYSSSNPTNFINSIVTSMSGKYIMASNVADCSSSDTLIVEVLQRPEHQGENLLILPNPNKGLFKILASVASDNAILLRMFTTDGKLVYTDTYMPINKKLDSSIDVRGLLSSGIYRLKLLIDGKISTYSLVID